MSSIRGYKQDEISPRAPNGDKIGGEQMVQFNLELIFPLIAKAGLKGVLFFDAGDVYRKEQSIDLGSCENEYGGGNPLVFPDGSPSLRIWLEFEPPTGVFNQ